MLQAFHNDQAVKDKYLARAHSFEDMFSGEVRIGDAIVFARMIGIPHCLAEAFKFLAGGISPEKAGTFCSVFLQAVPVGLTEREFELKVKAPFLVHVLEGVLKDIDVDKNAITVSIIKISIEICQLKDNGSKDWRKSVAEFFYVIDDCLKDHDITRVERGALKTVLYAVIGSTFFTLQWAMTLKILAVVESEVVNPEVVIETSLSTLRNKYDEFADYLIELLKSAKE